MFSSIASLPVRARSITLSIRSLSLSGKMLTTLSLILIVATLNLWSLKGDNLRLFCPLVSRNYENHSAQFLHLFSLTRISYNARSFVRLVGIKKRQKQGESERQRGQDRGKRGEIISSEMLYISGRTIKGR